MRSKSNHLDKTLLDYELEDYDLMVSDINGLNQIMILSGYGILNLGDYTLNLD